MKVLKIKWQRLLSNEDRQTCPRCGLTENELEKAVNTLRQSLAPLEIKVLIEKKSIDPATFAANCLESNRVWINNKPIEEWLEAKVGQSLCCEVCGDVECRTVEIGETIYETIPADLIIKAGLVAASHMIAIKSKESCCDSNISSDNNKH